MKKHMKAKIDGTAVHTTTAGGSYGKPVWASDATGEALMQVDLSVDHVSDIDITDARHVGELVRGWRMRKYKSQAYLAIAAGVSVSTVQNIEGDKTSPSIDNLCKVLDALGMRLVVAKK